MQIQILKDKYINSYHPDKIYYAEYIYLVQKGKNSSFDKDLRMCFCENAKIRLAENIKLRKGEEIKSVQIKLLSEIGKRNNY